MELFPKDMFENTAFFYVAGDNGSLHFWDWRSGYNFQRIHTAVQPGSIDSEAGIFASTFDKSGCRLITCEADKTIKIYKEDASAVCYMYTIINISLDHNVI
jgi:WD40 repeat protein